jgi:hypothetical protein
MRFVTVTGEEFEDLAPLLNSRLSLLGTEITPFNFPSLIGPELDRLINRTFDSLSDHGGAIWIQNTSRSELTLALHSDQEAQDCVAKTSTVSKICVENRVFEGKRPELENLEQKACMPERVLDIKRGLTPFSTIAVPLILFQTIRGVLSVSRYKESGKEEPFTTYDLEVLIDLSLLTQRLVEYPILSNAVGYKLS